MARDPISEYFVTTLARSLPTEREVRELKRHADGIKSRLARTFTLKRFAVIGSHSRGTAIRNASDADYIAVLSTDDARHRARSGEFVQPTTLLNWVRREIADRYQGTQVRGDRQAVVVGFRSGAREIDVVPAIFSRWGDGGPIYRIPGDRGHWIETSPDIHSAYIRAADQLAGGQLKGVVRLFKVWKSQYAQIIPIAGFHLELLLAVSGLCSGVKSYSECVYSMFKLLRDRQCAALQDPVGLSGYINAAYTERQRLRAVAVATTAFSHCQRAREYAAENRTGKALDQFRMVFG